jgi:hypothetical protein
MDIKNLPTFVLIIVMIGLLIGIGIIVLNKFEVTGYVDTDVVNESMSLKTSVATNVANTPLNSVAVVRNASHSTVPASNYSVSGNGITLLAPQVNGTYYADYEYEKQDTDVSTALSDTADAIDDISSDWLPLIVVVAVLSLILFFVVRSFGGVSRR